MRSIFWILAVTLLLGQSCHGLVREEKIIGDFYLVAVDSETETSLSFKISDGSYIGIVPATVYSAGYDSKYVYAKQHPEGANGKTNYYIIPIKVKDQYRVDEEVIGPLNKTQFTEKLYELGVTKSEDLFQITIDNL